MLFYEELKISTAIVTEICRFALVNDIPFVCVIMMATFDFERIIPRAWAAGSAMPFDNPTSFPSHDLLVGLFGS